MKKAMGETRHCRRRKPDRFDRLDGQTNPVLNQVEAEPPDLGAHARAPTVRTPPEFERFDHVGSQNSFFFKRRVASTAARIAPTTVPGPKHTEQSHPVNPLHSFLDHNSGFLRIPSRA